MKKIAVLVFLVMGIVLADVSAQAALITFDDAISGEVVYSWDGDGDGIVDVEFSTTDPDGFNTTGPGSNMSYINEPGLEGTTLFSADLRADFLFGASGSLKFGFALCEFNGVTADTFAEIWIYDNNDVLLGYSKEFGAFTYPNGFDPSNFPEGQLLLNFSGVASYALLNFSNSSGGGQRYLMDNFEGTFGSTEPVVPIPGVVWLLCSGLAGLAGLRWKYGK